MKKLISIILVLVMLLSLVACGNSEGDKETKKSDEKVYKDKHGDLAKEAEEKLPQYILEAIRAYYDVDFGGEITDKMVASVETLTIDIPAPYSDTEVYVDAAVNGSSFTAFGIRPGGKVYKDRMDNVRNQMNELYDRIKADPEEYKSEYNSLYIVNEEWFNTNYEKFLAYSHLIDKENCSYYVYDEYFFDYNPVRDLLRFYSTMLLANTKVINSNLDLSCLKVFPNLKSVKCDERFNARNCPVKLETLSVDYLGGHYKCGDNLTWKTENELLTITGSGDMWDFTGKGTPWVSDIRFVVIENGVTSIGADAFSGWAVQSATIPDSVTKISDSAFNDDHLKEITYNGTKAEWETLFDGEVLYKDRVICSDGRF